jgi:hypothetical protein
MSLATGSPFAQQFLMTLPIPDKQLSAALTRLPGACFKEMAVEQTSR